MAKARFVANVSHGPPSVSIFNRLTHLSEMRTPLTTIIGWTEVLLSSNLDHANKGYVEVIKVCGEYLLQIINDILEFAKIEDGKIELEVVIFDLVRPH